MHKSIKPKHWTKLNNWLDEIGVRDSKVPILGSGGNINKIYKMKRRRVADLHITTKSLKDFYQEAKSLTNKERIINYQLNPDRSDVIIPACEIFLDIIDITGSKKIYVPKTGLSDGIVRNLYEVYKGETDSKKN